ncbi:Uncharacterised protein [Serratia quinivorans]|nr:Uncharacterised protein [Serratia quinivorans]
MGTQPTGEQAIAVGYMHLVFGRGTSGAQAAGDDIGPVIDIPLGVADHRRPAGSARRGVNTHHLFNWYREGIERVVVA